MRVKTFVLFILISIINYFTIYSQDIKSKEVIGSIGKELTQSLLAGDYEKMMTHFTDDIIVFPVFDPPIKGKSAYREAIEKMKKQGIHYQSISGNSIEMWECGEMVYDIGTYGMSLISKDSPKPVAYYGSYFNVWQKQLDGSYKIKYMMSNLDFNPFEKRD